MDADELKEEIAHQRILQKEYRKRLRVLERQAAKFGDAYVPPHIQTELDDLRTKMDELEEYISESKQGFILKRRNFIANALVIIDMLEKHHASIEEVAADMKNISRAKSLFNSDIDIHQIIRLSELNELLSSLLPERETAIDSFNESVKMAERDIVAIEAL